jgi:diguanylate cyclase (GGDEF)-like protein
VVDLVRGYGVPIIVLTGSVDPSLRQAVVDHTVIDYMFKSGPAAIEDVAYLIGRLRQNQSMKVMVVDDSATFRHYVSALLAQYRFPIITATNGREALEQLEKHPDTAVVLTDCHMPEVDGLEMIRRIRRRFRREDLAIIAMSDNHHPELSAAMLKAGANDFLNKKFQSEEFYCRLVQNSNMVQYVRDLRDMANRDYLTRLHTRRHLFHAAGRLHAEALAAGGHLALAVVDADHFKRINDEFGHDAGDEALKKIAAVLRRGFPAPDIAARYGGEEFVCVTRIEDPDQAAARFDRLRTAIAAIDLEWQGTRIPVTASIGVTTVVGTSLASMIERADHALYRAKAEGRNRVVVG